MSKLTNSNEALDFQSIVNERAWLKNELQWHIDDLFNAFKEIRVIALDLNIEGLVPSEEEVDTMHWELWLEAFNTLENTHITWDWYIQVEEDNKENEHSNSN